MKKTFLAALAILCAFAFTSCDPVEPTKEELLKQNKGWILTAATSSPAYEKLDGQKIVDLFNHGYFLDFEKDDVYYYESTYALKVDPGKKLPTAENLADGLGYDKVTVLGTWVLNYPNLTTKVPGFYDKDEVTGIWTMDKVKILELTADKLVYEYAWDVAAKSPDYTFTLTFEKAK